MTMNRVLSRNLSFSLKRDRMANFGWWWHDEAGRFRRGRGQGPQQHNKFDHLKFTENPGLSPHSYQLNQITQKLRLSTETSVDSKFYPKSNT